MIVADDVVLNFGDSLEGRIAFDSSEGSLGQFHILANGGIDLVLRAGGYLSSGSAGPIFKNYDASIEWGRFADDGGLVLKKRAVGEIEPLSTTSNSTAVDFSDASNFSLTLDENSTLAQPSEQLAGQSGSIFVTQDATGSRTLAYHADWKWAGGTAPTLTTTAAAVDRIDYIVAAANTIHAVATLAVA